MYMIFKRAIVVGLLCLACAVYGSDAPSAFQGIRDNDVGSGSVVNFIDDEDAVNAVADAYNEVSGDGEDVEDVKDMSLWDRTKDVTGSIAVQYTDSKASMIALITRMLKRAEETAKKMNKRVDLWRKTKPTLEAYRKAAGRLLDDTKNLFNDFSWDAFFDPKRKWDKRRELLFDAKKDGSNWKGRYVKLYRDYTSYMASFYKDEKEAKKAYKRTQALLVPKIPVEKLGKLMSSDSTFDSDNISAFDNRMVPYNALRYSADAMFKLKEMESWYLEPDSSNDSLTRQQAITMRINKSLNKSKQTMVDSRELSAYIAMERADVREQIVRISQMQSQLDIYYGNLYSRNKAAAENAAMVYEHSLQILSGGADRYRHYQEIYGQDD